MRALVEFDIQGDDSCKTIAETLGLKVAPRDNLYEAVSQMKERSSGWRKQLETQLKK